MKNSKEAVSTTLLDIKEIEQELAIYKKLYKEAVLECEFEKYKLYQKNRTLKDYE